LAEAFDGLAANIENTTFMPSMAMRPVTWFTSTAKATRCRSSYKYANIKIEWKQQHNESSRRHEGIGRSRWTTD
jgi:hypothetical protein